MKKHRKTSKKRIIKKSNKKGQFFLMAGIIIILVLYTLTINYNWIRETLGLTGDYGELRDKQTDELPTVMTRSMFIITDQSKCKEPNPDPNCPIPAAEDFATQFDVYAKQRNPDFGTVLVLRDPYTGDIIVKNLLANEKWIKISTKNYKGDTIKLNVPLLSESDKVKGTITVGGLGSISVSAPITNLGEEFSKQNLGNVGSLEICVSEEKCMKIDLTDPGTFSNTVTNSQDNKGNINYDVCPPPKKSDGTYIDSNCF